MSLQFKFKEKLAQAQKCWQDSEDEAKKGSGFGSEISDGRYLCTIQSAELGESRSSGRLQIAYQFRILEGDEKGTVLYSYQGLDTVKGMGFFRRDIAKLGMEVPEDFEELGVILQKIVKKKIILYIQVKTSGEFQNKYIQKVVNPEAYGDLGIEEESAILTPSKHKKGVEEKVEEEDQEVNVGDIVDVRISNQLLRAEILELTDDDRIRIRTADGTRYKISSEKIEAIVPKGIEEIEETEEEVPEEPLEEEKPVKKVTQKKSTLKKGK